MIRRLECSSFLSLSFVFGISISLWLSSETKGRERERNGEEIVDMRNAHTFVICAWLHDQHCFINFISCQASLLRLIRLNIIISQCKNQGVAFSISISSYPFFFFSHTNLHFLIEAASFKKFSLILGIQLRYSFILWSSLCHSFSANYLVRDRFIKQNHQTSFEI